MNFITNFLRIKNAVLILINVPALINALCLFSWNKVTLTFRFFISFIKGKKQEFLPVSFSGEVHSSRSKFFSNEVHSSLSCSNEVHSSRKEFAPFGANSFPLELAPLRRGAQKWEMGKNTTAEFKSIFMHLNTEDPRYNDTACYQRYCGYIEFAVIKNLDIMDPSKA